MNEKQELYNLAAESVKRDMETSMWWLDGCFFDSSVKGSIEISTEYWQVLLDGQSAGKIIESNEEGFPILVEPGPRTLEEHRADLLNRIQTYDSSPAVNSFTIGDAELWFDKATRSSLAITLDAEAAAGKMTTTLWHGSEPPVAIEISIDEARSILSALDVYAKQVFDVTQRHRAALHDLKTIEDIQAYDHTIGYPEKLHFTAGE